MTYSAHQPRPLGVTVFRTASLVILCAASVGLCDPPTLKLDPEYKAAGDYVTIQPETTAKGVTYVGLSSVDPFPSALLRDPKTFVLPVRGLKAGRYRFTAVGSLNDEHATATFTVVVGDAPPGPPDVDPDEPDAPDVPDDGKLGLTKASRDGLNKVNLPPADRAKTAKALAAQQRAIAAAIAAGTLTDPAAILSTWRDNNRSVADPGVWKPWGEAVSAKLKALYDAKKILTAADWQGAFIEIAGGLE